MERWWATRHPPDIYPTIVDNQLFMKAARLSFLSLIAVVQMITALSKYMPANIQI
jgi:hypothetical protein